MGFSPIMPWDRSERCMSARDRRTEISSTVSILSVRQTERGGGRPKPLRTGATTAVRLAQFPVRHCYGQHIPKRSRPGRRCLKRAYGKTHTWC